MQHYVVVRTQLLCGAFALSTAWKERRLTSCNGRDHHMRIPCKARTSCSRSGLDQHQHRLAQVACSSCKQLRPPRHNLLLCLHTCPSLKPSPTLIQEVYFLLVNATTFSSSPSLADSALFPSLKQYKISRHTVTHEMRCSILKGHRCVIQACVDTSPLLSS